MENGRQFQVHICETSAVLDQLESETWTIYDVVGDFTGNRKGEAWVAARSTVGLGVGEEARLAAWVAAGPLQSVTSSAAKEVIVPGCKKKIEAAVREASKSCNWKMVGIEAARESLRHLIGNEETTYSEVSRSLKSKQCPRL